MGIANEESSYRLEFNYLVGFDYCGCQWPVEARLRICSVASLPAPNAKYSDEQRLTCFPYDLGRSPKAIDGYCFQDCADIAEQLGARFARRLVHPYFIR